MRSLSPPGPELDRAVESLPLQASQMLLSLLEPAIMLDALGLDQSRLVDLAPLMRGAAPGVGADHSSADVAAAVVAADDGVAAGGAAHGCPAIRSFPWMTSQHAGQSTWSLNGVEHCTSSSGVPQAVWRLL